MTDQQPDPKERITLSLTIDFDVDMKYKQDNSKGTVEKTIG